MKLHTCMISYNRVEIMQRSVESYLEKVSVPYTLVIMDNGSSKETTNWIQNSGCEFILLPENKYPGFVCNRGWEMAPKSATHSTVPTTTSSTRRVGASTSRRDSRIRNSGSSDS